MKPIQIPADLLPKDGRFGSGPSLVPDVAMEKLGAEARKYLGNSHRQENILDLVARFQTACRQLFDLPDDWEVLLGNGGASLFWDALSFCGIENKSQHLSFGEFSSKFAQVVQNTPHLEAPEIIESQLGTCPAPAANDEIDFYALTQNETTTGVVAEIVRPDKKTGESIVAVDATSAAGGILWDPAQADIYYFSLQKGFAADGGLWVACCSPQATQRFEKLATERWCPNSLNLHLAHQSALKHQTLNTPAVATIYLALHFAEWALENGGLKWTAKRSKTSSDLIYSWAEKCDWAEPFVKDPKDRSPVVATIDFADNISAADVSGALRENGIVDTEPYRKLDHNQLRFGLFPARDPEDVKALINCLEFVVDKFLGEV